jgi:hypothetical protein
MIVNPGTQQALGHLGMMRTVKLVTRAKYQSC